jgi:hypothetical protein
LITFNLLCEVFYLFFVYFWMILLICSWLAAVASASNSTSWVVITICNAQRLTKTLRRTEFLSCVVLTRSHCHPAAAEGAKLSTMRRGRAQICLPTACQTIHNDVQANAMLGKTKTDAEQVKFS